MSCRLLMWLASLMDCNKGSAGRVGAACVEPIETSDVCFDKLRDQARRIETKRPPCCKAARILHFDRLSTGVSIRWFRYAVLLNPSRYSTGGCSLEGMLHGLDVYS